MNILLLSTDAEIVQTVKKYSEKSGDYLETASDIEEAKALLNHRLKGSQKSHVFLLACTTPVEVLLNQWHGLGWILARQLHFCKTVNLVKTFPTS